MPAGASLPPSAPCPCDSGSAYDRCCGPLHRRESEARTAEQLMRSRYSAFVLGDGDHVFRTWHPHTRPDDVQTEGPSWSGLRILDTVAGGPDDTAGVVEFEASFPDGALRERSAFTRRRGRWVYVGEEAQASPESPGTQAGSASPE